MKSAVVPTDDLPMARVQCRTFMACFCATNTKQESDEFIMEENRYFQDALARFTHEAANGGAIRHLTDMGYTVEQIRDKLDFPAPYERVQQAVWQRLEDTGVILREEPGKGKPKEKAVYVREYDRYGKSTFRRVAESEEGLAVACWRKQTFACGDRASSERLTALLEEKLKENGEEFSYASCDFGLIADREPQLYERMLCTLGPERAYVAGLPWGKKRSYHRLNSRMRQILELLASAGLYQGELFFMKTKDKIRISEDI